MKDFFLKFIEPLLHTLSPSYLKKEVRSFFKPGSHHQWATVAIVGVIGFLGYLIYLATLVAPDIQIVQERFHNLAKSYENGGSAHFADRKEALRRDVSRTLRANKSLEARMIATNISVYLFPDLLPSENFERDVAEEQWIPMQREIEKSPGTYESRLKFEEMKANIWNYESPDKRAPKLTETAETVLHIYDLMSTQRQ
ncbi:MAG: hypothetical protein R3B54_14425 [Bdellovibrionota bacterium]